MIILLIYFGRIYTVGLLISDKLFLEEAISAEPDTETQKIAELLLLNLDSKIETMCHFTGEITRV